MENYLYLYTVFLTFFAVSLSFLGFKLFKKLQNEEGASRSFYEKEKTFTFQALKDFNVDFYALGLLFLLFFCIFIFLSLWAVAFESIHSAGFWAVLFIFFILVLGYVYTWKKGIFE